MALFIILKVIRSIYEGEVREKAFCAYAAGKLEKVIVGVAGVIVDALFDFKNVNREDRGFSVAKAGFGCKQYVFNNKSAFRAGIGSVVDGAERNLGARSGMHGVKVMNKRFHSLESRAVDFFFRTFKGKCLCFFRKFRTVFFGKKFQFCGFVFFAVLKFGPFAAGFYCFIHNAFCNTVAAFFVCKKFQCAAHILAIDFFIAFRNAGCHSVIKVRNALAAVLVVLVGLNGNAGQSRIACDILRFAKMAVAGIETVFKKFKNIYLAAGGGKGKKIQIVNMDISVMVGSGVAGIKNIHFVKLLCGLAAVFKHGTHGGIAVDVRVFAFNVVFFCGLESKAFQSLHQAGVHFAHFVAVCAVKNIAFCGAGMAGFYQHFFNHVLNMFNGRDFYKFGIFNIIHNHICDGFRFGIIAASVCFCGHKNSVCDFIHIKISYSAVAFYDCSDHNENLHRKNIALIIIIKYPTKKGNCRKCRIISPFLSQIST